MRTNPCRRRTLATSSDDGRLGTLQNQAVDVGVLDRGSVLGRRVLEVELQRLAEIGDRLLLGVTLAGHVDVEAPRDEPVVFLVDDVAQPALPAGHGRPPSARGEDTGADQSGGRVSTGPE